MAARRALFRCSDCDMQLHLITPVERPCPACGGEFIEIDEDEEYNPLELGMGSFRKPTRKKMNQTDIDIIVEENMDDIIEGLEALLAQH